MNPEKSKRVRGRSGEQLKRVAKIFAHGEAVKTLIWPGAIPKNRGSTANVRASCNLTVDDRATFRQGCHGLQHLRGP